jgi:hypothetical protein
MKMFLYFFKHHAMRICRGVEVYLHVLLNLEHYMEMSGQVHILGAFIPGKEPTLSAGHGAVQ